MLQSHPILSAINLHKTYRRNADRVQVLRGLDLEVFEGEFLSVVGSSGSGKSTMLHLFGTLDKPDEGAILLDNRRIDNLPAAQRDELRNGTFGFIFQFYHLLPELNTLENVMVPMMISTTAWNWLGRRSAYRNQAAEILAKVGLSHRLKHRPSELSGGEMQRAAIARALVNHPRVLLADEPTGNLDADTGAQIVRLLRDLNTNEGLTIIMVTHNLEIAAETDRIVRLVSGRVEVEKPNLAVLATGFGEQGPLAV